MVTRVLDALAEQAPPKTLTAEAVDLVTQGNQSVYLVPAGAMRRWVN